MSKHIWILSLAAFIALAVIGAPLAKDASDAKVLLPPPLSARKVDATASSVGKTLTLQDVDTSFTLYIPENWAPGSSKLSIIVHFNGDPNLVIAEHQRPGLINPLIVAGWGTGADTYRKPFKAADRFSRWLKLVEDVLKKESGRPDATIAYVDVSAYAGGYGALREIIKAPENVRLIRRVVLCDAMFASFNKDQSAATGKQKISSEHFDPWLPLVRAAADSEKTFVMTFSTTSPGSYAGGAECAEAFGEEVGAALVDVEPDSCAAANVDDYPLIRRVDKGNFHAWGYAGGDANARLTHLHHLGDVWKVLDEAGEP